MATMYPDNVAYHGAESAAERRLYRLLDEALPARYHVLCNRRWHLPGRDRTPPRTAEADFLVLHPDRGALVVEVKGGGIRHDARSGRWYSTDRHGTEHEIKDPFEQAARARYLLRDAAGTGTRDWPAGEAVAFPDGEPFRALPVGILPDRVITVRDLATPDLLHGAVDRAFDSWGLVVVSGCFGPDGIRAIVSRLGGAVEVRRVLGAALEGDDRDLIALTREQYRVLDALEGNTRMSVTGPAGTGKTLLAVEQARRLAARGHRVLLTCFNRALAEHLGSVLAADHGVEVVHFHGLCRLWAARAGIPVERGAAVDDARYFEVVLPDALVAAAERMPDDRFDAIIVDEIQDFSPEWLAALELLQRDERDGILFAFGDDNQAVYGRSPAPAGFPTFRLSVNCRNTRAIHRELVSCFGDASTAVGPDGEAVRLLGWSGEGGLAAALGRTLDDLVVRGRVPVDGIVVLTGRGVGKSELDGAPVNDLRVTRTPQEPRDLRLASVHAFKGLEAPVVILCELEHPHEETALQLWYTAVSRARTLLVILVEEREGPEGDLRSELTRLGILGASPELLVAS